MVTTTTIGYKILKKGTKKRINKQIHKDICIRFNIALRNLIIEEAFEYRMPCNLGFLSIKEFSHRKFDDKGNLIKSNIKVDFGNTVKYYSKEWGTGWKETQRLLKEKRLNGEELKYQYHFNENNLTYRWQWYKHYSYKNKRFFLFKPAKDSRLKLSQHIQNNKDLKYLR